jgi:hypothetical protein
MFSLVPRSAERRTYEKYAELYKETIPQLSDAFFISRALFLLSTLMEPHCSLPRYPNYQDNINPLEFYTYNNVLIKELLILWSHLEEVLKIIETIQFSEVQDIT